MLNSILQLTTDTTTLEFVVALVGILVAATGIGVAWGRLNQKVSGLEHDLNAVRKQLTGISTDVAYLRGQVTTMGSYFPSTVGAFRPVPPVSPLPGGVLGSLNVTTSS